MLVSTLFLLPAGHVDALLITSPWTMSPWHPRSEEGPKLTNLPTPAPYSGSEWYRTKIVNVSSILSGVGSAQKLSSWSPKTASWMGSGAGQVTGKRMQARLAEECQRIWHHQGEMSQVLDKDSEV